MDNMKIKKMKEAGKILGDVMDIIVAFIKPGVTELEIDNLAEREIIKRGGEPGFKKVPGYHHTICISVNDVVVHGIPTDRVIKKGDIVGVDCGVYLGGFHTDMAETVLVPGGKADAEAKKFLSTGKNAMFNAIRQVKAGNRVGHLSQAMQETTEGGGYSVVRSLVGHGVGRELHEEPEIPGYLTRKIERTPKLKAGMTIAIEIIYNMGSPEVVYTEDDDWTIVTEDGKLSGLFERTVLVEERGVELITRLKGDKI